MWKCVALCRAALLIQALCDGVHSALLRQAASSRIKLQHVGGRTARDGQGVHHSVQVYPTDLQGCMGLSPLFDRSFSHELNHQIFSAQVQFQGLAGKMCV